MSTAECETALDCILEREDNTTVYRDCFESLPGEEGEYICGCQNAFGFIGDFCDEPTPQTYIFLSIFILLGLCSLVVVVMVVFLLVAYNKLHKKRLNPSRLLLTLIILSSLSVMCDIVRCYGAFLTIADISTARLAEVTVFGEERIYTTTSLGSGSYLLKACTLYLAFSLMLVMMLYWLSIIQGISKVLSQQEVDAISRLEHRALVATITFSTLGVIFLCLRRPVPVNIIGIALAILLCVLCYIARRKFVSILRSMRKNRQSSMLIEIVQHFSTRYIILAMTLAGSFLSFTLVQALAAETKPGNFNFYENISELTYVLKTLIIIYTLLFVGKIFNNIRENAQHRKPSEQSSTVFTKSSKLLSTLKN